MKHHTVQEAYLRQWQSETNQLQIYLIPDNKYIEKGPNWKLFYKYDYNILDSNDDTYYLPETVTEVIDTKGIEAIRRIDISKQTQLSPEDRSAIAFYIALQYIRTPRFREETNKWFDAFIRYFMNKDITSPRKVAFSKKEMLAEKPTNKKDEEALEHLKQMSEAEIKQTLFDAHHNKAIKILLTKAGHSKGILKIDSLAEEVFNCQWNVLFTTKGLFDTSDNPCFAVSPSNVMSGLVSPLATVIFPLRPDVCIYMKPRVKARYEVFTEIESEQIQAINHLVLKNSYECVVSSSKAYLEELTKIYNYKGHRRSRDVIIIENGEYVMFNVE